MFYKTKHFEKALTGYGVLLLIASLFCFSIGWAGTLSPAVVVRVEGFEFTGNEIFSDQELAGVVEEFKGRDISAAELEKIRRLVTAYYIDHGYVHSGAVIPDQKLEDGVIRIKVEEGRLMDVEISGNRWLRSRYVKSRLERTAKINKPLNYIKVLERLRLLKEDPRIENIHAKIVPGLNPGEAYLEVEVKEARPYQVSVLADNHRSPSVGSYQVMGRLTHNNLTGWGDAILLQYGVTEGLDEYAGRYSVPLTRWDTLLSVYVEHYGSNIVSEPFDELDINSETDRVGGSIRQPVYKTLNREIALGLEIQRSKNKVSLGDIPFSFAPYEKGDQGIYKVAPLRFQQEYIDRGLWHVFALQSSLSYGLDLWDATVDVDERLFGEDPPNAEFFSWFLQTQFLLRVEKAWNSQFFVRASLQLTPDSLLPSEQFGLGGYATVRGYRENLMTTDNGACASLEWQIPLWRKSLKGWRHKPQDFVIQLAPFFDWGQGWNTDDSTDPVPDSIYSAGCGLRTSWGNTFSAAFYWGHALRDVSESTSYDLQDDGIHLAVEMNMF